MTETEMPKGNTERIKKYETHVGIYVFKAKNGKSLTITVKKEDFPEGEDELILNMSLEGFKEYLENEKHKRFELNRIRYV